MVLMRLFLSLLLLLSLIITQCCVVVVKLVKIKHAHTHMCFPHTHMVAGKSAFWLI